jgi:hypothetical protein
LRSEIATQSLVWNVFWVQSYCASLAMNSCPKNVVIAACRSSSSAPKVAMFRQEPFRPNLAILSSASTAAYSTSATPPKCILVADFQPSLRLSNAEERCSAALTAYAADSFSRWVATYSG